MSQVKVQTTTAIEWEGELNDADLMAVTGGSAAGTLVNGVAATNSAIGNGGRPTSGALNLLGDTLIAGGEYVKTVAGGVEGGLQAVNGTVSGTASHV